MQKRTKPIALGMSVTLCALLPLSSWAHHSSALYDVSKEIILEGVVKQFKLINPHSTIELEVIDSKSGNAVAWMAEGESASVLKREGWTADQFKSGEHLTIKGHPSHDGSLHIAWTFVSTRDANGQQRTVEIRGTVPSAAETAESFREIDERRREERAQRFKQP